METNLQKFELSQNGRNYILTTGIRGDIVRLTCVETGISNPPVYFGEFSLTFLRQLSKIFTTITTIYEAQEILNQTIETQKVTVEHKGNIINIILFLQRESESEDISIIKEGGANAQSQGFTYTQPITYKTVENVTTTTTTNTLYSQDQGAGNINLNLNITTPVETTSTQEVYTTTNDNYQNYDNYKNYENYQNYDTTANIDLNTVNTYETVNTVNAYDTANEVNTYDTVNIANTYDTVNAVNTYDTVNTVNTYDTTNTYDVVNTTDTQIETNYYNKTVTPEVQTVTLPLSLETNENYAQTQTEAYETQYYAPEPTTTQYEQIQYSVPNSQITYTTVEKNPDRYQQKIVETTKTTTTEHYPVEQPQVPSVDMTLYNQKITQLQTETNRIREEYEHLKNEANKLNGEVGQLKGQITILLEENKVLRQKNGSMPNEAQIHEIAILKQENERLRKQLEQYITLQSTFERYKKLKEEEINYFKRQIEELIKKQKKSDEILLLKQREIDELKFQIQQLIKNVNISESKNVIMRQQQKAGQGSIHNQMLTIQDTRMEIVKGDIIQSSAELEFLTRKICQNHKKVTLNLLYKATLDSDKASVFHNKCDFANRTLVLVKSGNGKRFGGYTTCNWKGNSIEKKDDNAFVFSLDKMKIYDIIPGEDAIGCFPKYGPVFLGCQIRIYDEFFTNGGTTFEKGLNYNTEEDYELTGGLKEFEVKEIEVYGIQLE